MTSSTKRPNARWISHRITAHRMHRRGQSIHVIADTLRVSTRSVSRYLDLACPEPLQEEEVGLEDFYMQGACGEFPEYDWTSRSLRMQAECKAICEHCPVLEKCRSYGLTKGRAELGIWGAMTANERAREIRRRRTAEVAEQRGVA